ncbi:DUF4258 domain-containing protein [Methylocapsa palsarum]|uniref:Uncharacterized protein n=1 Tax=Methylocapsa palsarum TaxID=1612308 RepID=A0A1I4AHP7_9HYPH|nr:DUF4258 domain-containing protein [Methylocapsa palsarum]SFK55537.1 hypothetical protein SAMN05444581_11089 [Methylocapsa palsarum]
MISRDRTDLVRAYVHAPVSAFAPRGIVPPNTSAREMELLVERAQELLHKWNERAERLHPCMEITGEGGLMLGAGTMLGEIWRDEYGRPRLAIDGARTGALLASAFERPVAADGLAKLQRAAVLWNEDEKALAHIHLAHIGLPPCDEAAALRLFIADALLTAGASPQTLIEAQNLAPHFAKFNIDQPRVPAGNGRESGQWAGEDAGPAPAAFRSRRERGGRRGSGGFHAIHEFLDWLRGKSNESAQEDKSSELQPALSPTDSISGPVPEQHVSSPKPSDFVGQDFGKLGVGIEKPQLGIREFDSHAAERMIERGISINDMHDTVDRPLIVLQQTRGRVYYLSDNVAVVLNPKGRVITTYSASDFDAKVKALLGHIHK